MRKRSAYLKERLFKVKRRLSRSALKKFTNVHNLTAIDILSYVGVCAMSPVEREKFFRPVKDDVEFMRALQEDMNGVKIRLTFGERDIFNGLYDEAVRVWQEEREAEDRAHAVDVKQKRKFLARHPKIAEAIVANELAQSKEARTLDYSQRIQAQRFSAFNIDLQTEHKRLGDVRAFEVADYALKYQELAFIFHRLSTHIKTIGPHNPLSAIRNLMCEDLVNSWVRQWREIAKREIIIEAAWRRLDAQRRGWRRNGKRVAMVEAALDALGADALQVLADKSAAMISNQIKSAAEAA